MPEMNTRITLYNPLHKWERLFACSFSPEQGILLWISLTTVLAAAGEIRMGGFTFRGFAWVLTCLVCVFYLIPNQGRSAVSCNWLLWVPWVIWMICKTDFSEREAAQRFCIFLTPLIAMSACSAFRQITIVMVQKCFSVISILSVLMYLLAVVQSRTFLALTPWYSLAGIAMTFTLLAVAACADLSQSPRKAFIRLAVYFLILLLSESRMPVLAVPFIFSFGLNYQSWKSKMCTAAAVVIAGFGLFYTGPVQENLFKKGYGTFGELVSFDPTILNSSGRLSAWPEFIRGMDNIWLGDGAASSAEFGYATFRGWTHPHNEYIRVLFDYGIVGFILLSIPALTLLISLYQRAMRQRNNPDMRWIYSICVNGFLAMLLLGLTGNVLMYISYIGNLLFALIGCTHAMERSFRETLR